MSTLIKALKVVAKAEGFRRAGRAWSTKPTTVPLAELQAEQVEALHAEPALVVTEVDIEPEAAPKAEAKTGGATGKAANSKG